MTEVEKWIVAWAKVPQGELYPADKPYLEKVQEELGGSRRRDKQFNVDSLDPKEESNGKFHFGLGAVPYVGNLRKAQIFLLMVNPGVRQSDYDELGDKNVQELLKQNRLQKFDHCFALNETGDKRQGWVDYFSNSVFGTLIREFPQKRSDVLRATLRAKLAILELVPYFSQTVALIDGCKIAEVLPSAQLALNAVAEIAKDKQNLIIPRWPNGAKRWHLKTDGEEPNEGFMAKVEGSPPRTGLGQKAKKAILHKLEEIAR
jgi:hypothetical protein